jgi:hypothetical protein
MANDFTSKEPREYRFKIGHAIASCLSGVIAGTVIASIIWLTGIWCIRLFQSDAAIPITVSTPAAVSLPR